MKKWISLCAITAFLILSVFVAHFSSKNNLEVLIDSLVYIETLNEDGANNGSGFVYKYEKGYDYILTNYHIIDGFNKIYVYNKNKKSEIAYVEFYDESLDIAVLKIDSKLDLKPIKIGNSDKIKVADEIYALGTPIDFRYFGTLSSGIISSLNRKINVDGNIYNTIQIDANVNLGNSGGPLLNKKGEVIGIIFVKEEDVDGVSFALPINDIINTIRSKV